MKRKRKRKRKRPLTLRGATSSSVRNDDTVKVVESSIAIDIPSIPVTLPSPSVSLSSLICGPVERYLLHLWTNYYPNYFPPGGAFGEEGSLMPGSAINFIIGGLFALVAIKAQGNTGFPFQTNPRTMKVSVNSLIMFALASAAEHVLSVGRPARNSVSAIVARFGRMVSLVILNQLGCQGFRNRRHHQPLLFKCVHERAWLM